MGSRICASKLFSIDIFIWAFFSLFYLFGGRAQFVIFKARGLLVFD